MENSPTNSAPVTDGLRAHACVLCQRRKVKCDRMSPCSGCSKARVECEYRNPLPPRRRKRKNPESDVLDRMKLYENALQKAGIDVGSLGSTNYQAPVVVDAVRDSSHTVTMTATDEVNSRLRGLSTSDTVLEHTSRQGSGRLITKKGRSLYLDNHLWKSVSHELQDAEDIISEYDSDDSKIHQTHNEEDFNSSFIFGGGSSRQTLTHLHPNPIQIFKLWNTFLEGVHPITKIIHAPTLQKKILDAAADLASLSPELEALMFTIYSTALMCIQDDEVENVMQEPKSMLLTRYRQCSQQALVNAGVIGTSDLTVLQAFIFYILSIRLVQNPHVVWSLSGIAMRIAQRIGLHKDGAELGLSVFETEMRRRIWWNVIVLDSTIGHMAGCESHMAPITDTKTPLNVDDSALDPQMKEQPVESTGPTEMIFCLLCYDLGVWFAKQQNSESSSFDGGWNFLSSVSISLEQKDKLIDEIEHTFETKYIRHCDQSIDLHLLAFVIAKSAISSVRLRAHHPRQYQEKGLPVPQKERDLLFQLCCSIMENANLLLSSQGSRKFHWHMDFHFPWDAFIVMLLELRYRSTGQDTSKAWQLIDTLFHRQYKVLSQRKKSPLHLAVANLAIKAWSSHVTESEREGLDTLPQPQVIGVLWKYVNRAAGSASNASGMSTPAMHSSPSSVFIINAAERTSGPVHVPHNTIAKPSDYLIRESNPITSDPDQNHDKTQSFQSQALASKQPSTSYPTADGDSTRLDMNTIYHHLDDSPMDWSQWDTLLQEFQEHSTDDTNIFFAPLLA